MQLHLHPTRRESLTASNKALTRWSLATNPATVLAQMSTAPESVFYFKYDPKGRLHAYGGITGAPDGLLFAMEQLDPERYRSPDPCVMEWHRWDDFSLARTSTVLHKRGEIGSLACSPDGRWLVLEDDDQIFLLDWRTGEVVSHHIANGYATSGLTFDPTSTFVAGLSYADGGGLMKLWRLDTAERFVPRPVVKDWRTHELVPQDYVSGSMALTLVHRNLDRKGIEWPERDLADTACVTAFSPDSHIVIFCPMNSGYSGCAWELVAYEVTSGKRLWGTRSEEENTGEFIISPDASVLLVPVQGGDLLVYRVENGALVQRLPTGLTEPIEALAFDHDGRTLWLATEEALVQYQPQG